MGSFKSLSVKNSDKSPLDYYNKSISLFPGKLKLNFLTASVLRL